MRRVALLLPLLFLPAAPAAPVPKAVKGTQDLYPSVLGTKWVYAHEDGTNEHTREVTGSQEKDGVTHFTVTWKQGPSTQIWDLKKDATGVYRLKQDTLAFDPPHKLIQPKMTEGEEWESEYTAGGRVTYKFVRSVGKPEQVKTPAGEFTALPINSKDLSGNTLETTLWYADGVGLVKLQAKGGTASVLKEFTPGGKK
jgi:hypothetical protein